MAKQKYTSGRCAHCLKHFDKITSDHVFPVSWYPKTTPADIEKWQMPSCLDCNSKYGKIEEELLLNLGLCLDPRDHNSIGISDKVLRSINPMYGRNHKDAYLRQKRRDKVIRESINPTTMPMASIFPNFGFHSKVDPQKQLAILVSDQSLRSIGEKFIRGITWVIDKRYIEADHEIEIYFFRENLAGAFIEPIRRFGKEYSLGPGIRILRAVAHEDPISGLYLIEIWRKLKMYGSVGPINMVEDVYQA
jgi:hypothetical protein